MAGSTPKTAILVFTRQAEQEAAAKKFTFISARKNFRVADSFIKHTLATVRQSKIPYYISGGEEFSGTDFHQKLTRAAAEIFGRGIDKLIIIGNDCPGLTSAILQKTETTLETSSLVLGPATDGGVYLIGLTKTAFQAAAFANLPWLTNQVFTSLQQYGNQFQLPTTFLPVLQDIDSESDLKNVLAHSPKNIAILWVLRQILANTTQVIHFYFTIFLSSLYFHQLPNRAPPIR